ncbi:hypothetical protein PV387_03525 [Streptomyces sp. ME02-6987-2C]|uniref:hypothetical protein n=1 Tax=unclassified Streptomyces TaxID=2593676 RepID=UPI0029B9D22B|nr:MULTISPECIES: hypothetical protein [unclassified Streptomyces]MDX3345911.1 hypothetical protein [Streptomyces sp. ME02-6979A]MDX3365105.1 hypothetical protein [Streptomyces sp. ME02-6987-2C]MDX3404839.1 hypothetical protein [Streptomyces sp. ME02-6977A]MDX3421677.1 hypothetical protein [Streptomyces sp. ME02-6985-2c]
MVTAQAALGASATTGHGFTLLDHDVNGWTVALVVAVVAAFIYEAIMALTRMVTLRIPFLVLYLARITTPKRDWFNLFSGWKGELWAILRNREKHWFLRFCKGMAFATPLALGAARVTAKAATPSPARQRTQGASRSARRRMRRFSLGFSVVFALAGMNGPWLWRSFGGASASWPLFAAGATVVVPTAFAVHFAFRRSDKSRKSGQK